MGNMHIVKAPVQNDTCMGHAHGWLQKRVLCICVDLWVQNPETCAQAYVYAYV